ncbi:porin family protein [Paraflavisolibacter sp. H34]|uniref:porin family protein n=1 Tax=Huijunlia imazamoxiresistens TaxID=3127457 RepID=UPI00301A6C3E
MRKSTVKGLLLCLLVPFVQKSNAQVRVGVFGGGQVTSAKYSVIERFSQEKIKQSTGQKAGLQLGTSLKVPFENQLYFSPAVYYSLKGYKVTLNRVTPIPDSAAVNNETRIHTIEIAPLLQYDFSAKPSHFFVKAGPAVDVAISGQENFDTKDQKHIDRPMKFSYQDYGVFTAQAIVQFGYEAANGLYVFAHYAHGIGSLNNNDHGPRILHRIAGLSLGWYLNGKK